jgi:hypothetical protein
MQNVYINTRENVKRYPAETTRSSTQGLVLFLIQSSMLKSLYANRLYVRTSSVEKMIIITCSCFWVFNFFIIIILYPQIQP